MHSLSRKNCFSYYSFLHLSRPLLDGQSLSLLTRRLPPFLVWHQSSVAMTVFLLSSMEDLERFPLSIGSHVSPLLLPLISLERQKHRRILLVTFLETWVLIPLVFTPRMQKVRRTCNLLKLRTGVLP